MWEIAIYSTQGLFVHLKNLPVISTDSKPLGLASEHPKHFGCIYALLRVPIGQEWESWGDIFIIIGQAMHSFTKMNRLPMHPTLFAEDRPLLVQLATNDPGEFSRAVEMLTPYCDGVDLNCGCPQRWCLFSGLIACDAFCKALQFNLVLTCFNRAKYRRLGCFVCVSL